MCGGAWMARKSFEEFCDMWIDHGKDSSHLMGCINLIENALVLNEIYKKMSEDTEKTLREKWLPTMKSYYKRLRAIEAYGKDG